MTHPQPTRKDHERFCALEGWTVRTARGRTGTHHITYELALPDGRILRTRISHPPDHTSYGPSLWQHVIRDHLQITDAGFWACVRDNITPDRGVRKSATDSLPTDLVYLLINRVGVPENEVMAMTKEQAINRINEHWASTGTQP
ncbi:hypothetical protein [Saccharopolyspora spinosa]|uniref:Cytotoxic translational repressor of toxin-antitoxin stability system n=1 Tax=Saccharopolyspora spinosa TaxID=60894 RepID=A0A2N3XWN3_SACSN|nr:hypothetical protein [Saccharopolyspora spinosa]PKW15074.1 hypothetical protein A8926_2753 [Saccharopolyspora spinosa]